MNNGFKKFFLWIISVAIVFFVSLKLGSELHAQTLSLSDYVKKIFWNSFETITSSWNEYFNQVQTIRELRERLQDDEVRKIKNLALESENRILRNTLEGYESVNDDIENHLVRVLSYVQLGNYERVWLEHSLPNVDDGAIFGLVFDNMVAGIAVGTQGRLMGIFNGDSNSVYSVYIGENKAPGIINATRGKQLLVANYIPQWIEINIGDEVVTSGLDGIFFEGIKVGQVSSIRTSREYYIVEIKPYLNIYDLHYVWLVDLRFKSELQPKLPNLIIDDANLTNKDND